jgi:hypothetical protein
MVRIRVQEPAEAMPGALGSSVATAKTVRRVWTVTMGASPISACSTEPSGSSRWARRALQANQAREAAAAAAAQTRVVSKGVGLVVVVAREAVQEPAVNPAPPQEVASGHSSSRPPRPSSTASGSWRRTVAKAAYRALEAPEAPEALAVWEAEKGSPRQETEAPEAPGAMGEQAPLELQDTASPRTA